MRIRPIDVALALILIGGHALPVWIASASDEPLPADLQTVIADGTHTPSPVEDAQ